jgi:hypothetical protein
MTSVASIQRLYKKGEVSMNSTHDPGLSHRTVLRIGLLFLVATALGVGLWALFLPRVFYDDFPFPGRAWVSTLGPYNEHLVRDYGELNLALAVLLAFAAIFLERRLVQASLLALLAYTVPHFVFHADETLLYLRQCDAALFYGVIDSAPSGAALPRCTARWNEGSGSC